MNLISGDFDFFWKDIAGFRRKRRQTKEYSCSIFNIAENLLPELQEVKRPCTTTMCVANGKHVGIIWQKVKSRRVTKNDTGVPNRQ